MSRLASQLHGRYLTGPDFSIFLLLEIMRAHDILKGDSTLVYSREKLLELYSPSLSLPKDVDLSLGAIAEEKRAPLAHSPFSEAETRLLSLASINSESNRRGYNNGKKAKPPQASSTGNVENFGHFWSSSNILVAKKTKESTEDLWDIPTKTTGTFKSDGIFGFSNPPAKVEKNVEIINVD